MNDTSKKLRAASEDLLARLFDEDRRLDLYNLLRNAAAEIDVLSGREKRVFELGWRTAASWADRTDLFFDTGSPAYIKDRDAALAEAAGIDGETK